jgi:hypothetical protein
MIKSELIQRVAEKVDTCTAARRKGHPFCFGGDAVILTTGTPDPQVYLSKISVLHRSEALGWEALSFST